MIHRNVVVLCTVQSAECRVVSGGLADSALLYCTLDYLLVIFITLFPWSVSTKIPDDPCCALSPKSSEGLKVKFHRSPIPITIISKTSRFFSSRADHQNSQQFPSKKQPRPLLLIPIPVSFSCTLSTLLNFCSHLLTNGIAIVAADSNLPRTFRYPKQKIQLSPHCAASKLSVRPDLSARVSVSLELSLTCTRALPILHLQFTLPELQLISQTQIYTTLL